MKSFLFIAFIFAFAQGNSQTDASEFEKTLASLPGVEFKKYSKPEDRYLKYVLRIKQSLDHWHPEKGSFYQVAVLTHKGFDKPTVMETEGYEVRYGGNEIEKMLDANNINIEHRFFGTSRPDSLQWQYLTFEQVTADLHHVNQLFRTIYKNKWISTGISRGGQVAIYYKYFFPKDVDLAVPYVAPLPNSLEDKRIYHFLDTIGSPECRSKIYQLQKFLLANKKEAVEKFKWYAKGRKISFKYFSNLEEAFEFAILEYPFAFWQIGATSCDQIPANKSVDDYLDHLIKEGGIEYFSDKYLNEWAAHTYMAKTQMGYYGYDLSRFRDDLHYIKGPNPCAALVPRSIPSTEYDSTFTQKISKWLDEKGDNILYIYGSRDTWSACRVIVSPKVNSKSFMIPNANHFEARVKNMSTEMRADFAASIMKLLGTEVNLEGIK